MLHTQCLATLSFRPCYLCGLLLQRNFCFQHTYVTPICTVVSFTHLSFAYLPIPQVLNRQLKDFQRILPLNFFIFILLLRSQNLSSKGKGKTSTSFLHAYSFLDLPFVSTNEENSCLHQQLTIYCIRAVSFVMLIISCRNLETKKRQPLMIHILSSS